MKRPPGKEKLQRVRSLRREMTPAERRLWSRLRANRLGFKFRRQIWLCGFVPDFVCLEAKLVVEVDGSQHADAKPYDTGRSAAFAREGFRTLRFWNNDIFENLDGVLIAIVDALPPPSHPAAPGGPLPLSCGEREK